MTTKQAPMPPRLEPAGKALWSALAGAYDFTPAESAMLATACRQADDVARLEHLLADQGPIVEGSAGQPRLSPVLAELRQGRLDLAKLLDHLDLPGEDEAAGMTPAQRRASKAASVRWANHRALRGDDGAA